jgi:hypothetical protein
LARLALQAREAYREYLAQLAQMAFKVLEVTVIPAQGDSLVRLARLV